MKKIVIAGGSGYLGTALQSYFSNKVTEIVILSRKPENPEGNVHTVLWDAKTQGLWVRELEGADVIINLTGKSVDCRYNESNRKLIYSSRLDSTQVIGDAITQCKQPPAVWVNASSATIYKASFDLFQTENAGEVGNDFSMDICKQWEACFNSFNFPCTRKLALRTSIVLGKNGGALVPLKNLVKLGVGGYQGNGKQYCSWLHELDFCRIVEWLINHTEASGVYNVTSPNPVPNSDFMRLLRDAMHVPFGIPLPKPLLYVGAMIIRTQAELILKSRKVKPEKLMTSNFEFKFPTLEGTFKDLI